MVVIDPEGDHLRLQQLNHVYVVDGHDHLAEPAELVDTLLNPHSSTVVDLSGLDTPTTIDHLRRLRPTVEAYREQQGFPHWVIYDEAHLLGHNESAHWARGGGYVLSSFAPGSLPANEIDNSDVVLTLPDTTGSADPGPARRATARFASGPARPFTIAERLTAHVRHRHKYADIHLPQERRFYFHNADGHPVDPAANMHEFSTALRHLDHQTFPQGRFAEGLRCVGRRSE